MLAYVLIGLGLLATAGLSVWIGYLIGRTVEVPERAKAQEFADALTAPVWKPAERPVPPPRYDPRAQVDPIPAGVWGAPLGSRRPVLAQAFVGSGGKRSRPDGVLPSTALVAALSRYQSQPSRPGEWTQEFDRITAPLKEAEHVGP